jgi:hypothetical protein
MMFRLFVFFACCFDVQAILRNETLNAPPLTDHNDENRLKTFVHYSKPSSSFVIQRLSTEEYLHQEGLVPLNNARDVRDMKGTANCEGSIRSDHLSEAQLAAVPILVISGEYGHQRRLFAVTVAATFGMEHIGQSRYTTFYLNPCTYDLRNFYLGKGSTRELVAWIKREISVRCGSSDKLRMHISLVLDQSYLITDGYFHRKKNLLKLVNLLKRDVADSVRLVVCGEGYTDDDFSDADSFFIYFRE